jgi:hypothetical protein
MKLTPVPNPNNELIEAQIQMLNGKIVGYLKMPFYQNGQMLTFEGRFFGEKTTRIIELTATSRDLIKQIIYVVGHFQHK